MVLFMHNINPYYGPYVLKAVADALYNLGPNKEGRTRQPQQQAHKS